MFLALAQRADHPTSDAEAFAYLATQAVADFLATEPKLKGTDATFSVTVAATRAEGEDG